MILNLPSSDFPNQMYLFCPAISGFLDSNGDPTHVVAIYRLRQIVPCVVNNMVTYTLIYGVLDQFSWSLGLTRSISFYFGDESGAYSTPLA